MLNITGDKMELCKTPLAKEQHHLLTLTLWKDQNYLHIAKRNTIVYGFKRCQDIQQN